jgi:hypothetical protein
MSSLSELQDAQISGAVCAYLYKHSRLLAVRFEEALKDVFEQGWFWFQLHVCVQMAETRRTS